MSKYFKVFSCILYIYNYISIRYIALSQREQISMRLIITCALGCLTAITLPANSQTLEEAVAITFSTSPQLKSAFNDYMSFKKDIDVAEGSYLPNINLNAGIGYEGLSTTSNDSRTDMNRKEASLTLSQLIWDGAATFNDISRVSAEAESMRYQLLTNAQDLALEVANIYLDVLKAEEIVALSESNLEVHLKIHKNIIRRTESGIGSTADLSQAEGRLAEAHNNVLLAQNNLSNTLVQFTRLVGVASQGLIFPKADVDLIPLTFEEALAKANEQHTVIQTALVDIDSARYQYKQSKGVYYPTITFEASQNWKENASGLKGSREETTAMLNISYNLFNGGSDQANTENLAYQLNKARDLRDKSYRVVQEQLQLAWNMLNLSTQQKDFLSSRVDSISKTVIAYEKQYKIGQRTLLDVLNSENELFDARKSYLDAHYNEQLAKYRVMNSTGNLLDALRVEIPEEWKKKNEY
ncbi:outer membrane protein, adhesin transport system [Vibrio crassostreae]|nr:outer membrane protein, adhesin transport system [Vibrio crassostreae]CAK3863586.1 outer membrane protein, adhesin transport system [Vibrio crassostreae]